MRNAAMLFSGPGIRWLVLSGVLIAISLFFHLASNGVFLSAGNVVNLFRQSAIVAILAIGMLPVIVSGNIDLSVGSLVAFTGGIATLLLWEHQLPVWLAVTLALGAGAAAGLAQGALVAYLNIPAFIVTLGGLLVFRGWISTLMGGETIPAPESYQYLGGGFLNTIAGWLFFALVLLAGLWLIRRQMLASGKGNLLWLALVGYALVVLLLMWVFIRSGNTVMREPITTPIRLPEASVLFHSEWYQQALQRPAPPPAAGRTVPLPVAIMVSMALLMALITGHSVFGRRIYAIGGNAEAAFLSGINIRRHTVYVFALCGLLSAVAGVVYSARLGSATPDAARGYELYAIAACVIGGTSLRGGRGVVAGAVLGALIMASLDAGMSILNVDPFYQDIIKGLVLIGAVYADLAGRRRSG